MIFRTRYNKQNALGVIVPAEPDGHVDPVKAFKEFCGAAHHMGLKTEQMIDLVSSAQVNNHQVNAMEVKS